jgi:hypothetical protein
MEKQIVWATHYAPDADLFKQVVDGVAWRKNRAPTSWQPTTAPSTPSWSDSRPSEWVPRRIEVESSHVPMLSRVDIVLDAIRDLAAAALGRFSAHGAGTRRA